MNSQIANYLKELKYVIDNFSVDILGEIINAIKDVYKQNKKIFIMGNGGSASTASHFACDINKGVGQRLKNPIKVICLNDNIPIMLAYANDLSFEDIFTEQLKNNIEGGDLVIAISTSGRSKNILKAINFANNCGAVTVGLTGGDGGLLAQLSKYALIIKSCDIQKIEDLHMIITHILMQVLPSVLSQ